MHHQLQDAGQCTGQGLTLHIGINIRNKGRFSRPQLRTRRNGKDSQAKRQSQKTTRKQVKINIELEDINRQKININHSKVQLTTQDLKLIHRNPLLRRLQNQKRKVRSPSKPLLPKGQRPPNFRLQLRLIYNLRQV